MLADLATHYRVENLRPTTRQATKARFPELGQQLLHWLARDALKPVPLHCRVSLQVNLRIFAFNER